MRTRLFIAVLLGIIVVAMSACGGKLYKIAPLPDSLPPEITSDNADKLSAGAYVLEGDSALERFDANLPLAGVVAVDVQLQNKTAAAIDASKIRFELRDQAGTRVKSLSPKKALGRVMKYYGNSYYALASRQRTREDYEAVALKTGGDIPSQEARRGILFFQTSRDTTNLSGLTLSIKGNFSPIELHLNAR